MNTGLISRRRKWNLWKESRRPTQKMQSTKKPNRFYDLLPQAFVQMIWKYFFMKTRNKSNFSMDK